MFRIGIDVGSTYTKYCVMRDRKIISLFMEKTPIRQKEYFDKKKNDFLYHYEDAKIVSCGYGKKNVEGICDINELTALARGVYYASGKDGVVLDIGGQDTKIILQKKGRLIRFFLNDKCAAGSGMFLTNTLDMIDMSFEKINLSKKEAIINLNSTCAVFAQSEVVELIADNKSEEEIVNSVLFQIFSKSKVLLSKLESGELLLSGGLSSIKGIEGFAGTVLGRRVYTLENGAYLASIGCAITSNI